MYCLDPPLSEIPTTTWYCADCAVSKQEVKRFLMIVIHLCQLIATKLLLAYKEIQIECKRLLLQKCDDLYYKHMKGLKSCVHTELMSIAMAQPLGTVSQKKVLRNLRHLVADLTNSRSELLASGNATLYFFKEYLKSPPKSQQQQEPQQGEEAKEQTQ